MTCNADAFENFSVTIYHQLGMDEVCIFNLFSYERNVFNISTFIFIVDDTFTIRYTQDDRGSTMPSYSWVSAALEDHLSSCN